MINQNAVHSWDETRMAFLDAYLQNNQKIVLNIESSDQSVQDYSLDLSHIALLKTSTDFLDQAGIFAWRPPQVIRIDQVLADSAALAGGSAKNMMYYCESMISLFAMPESLLNIFNNMAIRKSPLWWIERAKKPA